MTSSFAAFIHSWVDQNYCMDGPLLFITMCNHIHRNHLAFVESIKHKIRISTLTDHKNNVPDYLQFLQDNLRISTSTGDTDIMHNDLIPHIFMQLCLTTIPLFQQRVLTWQHKYMENTLPLSPMTLITMADEECQILRHSNQWVETIDPFIVAMKAALQGTAADTKALYEHLTAHLTKLVHNAQELKQTYVSYDNKDGPFRHYSNDNPPWVYDAPEDMQHARTFRGKTWSFCTKCGRHGKWVCTHTNATHRPSPYQHHNICDSGQKFRYTPTAHYQDYRNAASAQGYRSRSRTPPQPSSDSASPMHQRSRSVSFKQTPPQSPQAKLTFLDSINAFIQEE